MWIADSKFTKKLSYLRRNINFVKTKNRRLQQMSEITGIIDALESKIGMLIKKIDDLEAQKSQSQSQLIIAEAENKKHLEKIAQLEASYETLRLANSLLGGDESKKDAKLKINSMIREIDYCISQLAE